MAGVGRLAGDESSLTPLQREVVTELQKILMTLNQINESLQKTIALAKEDGEMRVARQEAAETGRRVFEGALGIEAGAGEEAEGSQSQ